MRQLVIVVAGAMLIGAQAPNEPARSPQAQALLDQFLADRVPGESKRCLGADKTNSPIGIDDRTLLFRDGPRIWRNELQGGSGCWNLAGNKALTSFERPVQVCKGDRMYVMDLRDGMQVGGCILGEFTLYTKRKKD
jgi:hypothetical protein